MSGQAAAALVEFEASTREWVMTADPGFLDLALEEARGVDPRADLHRELAPGVLLIGSAASFGEVAAAWAAAPPIFVRHICPVQAATQLAGSAAGPELIAQSVAAEIAPYLAPGLPFSVQTRVLGDLPFKPFDVNQAVAPLAAEIGSAPLDVRGPEQVISVVCAGGPGGGTAYLGLSATAHNLSDWAGGARRFAREEGQVSRSEFKLLEALEIFRPVIAARGSALDLGAAPGGWTRVLRARQQYVTAVDPGELDPRVAQDRGVRHKRMTAEAYLANDPDPFDIVVNDMRMDGRDSARLMVTAARLLYPHGWALMTLKLPEQKRRPVLDHAFALLRPVYTIAGARHLFHNRSEITLYLLPLDRRDSSASASE